MKNIDKSILTEAELSELRAFENDPDYEIFQEDGHTFVYCKSREFIVWGNDEFKCND